jgi:hydrogenase maturation factor HypF (carbamoyltransferase family)
MVGKTEETAYPILANAIVEQMKLVQTENSINGVTDVRLCGEMASNELFVNILMEKLNDYKVSLMTNLSQLPCDESVNPVDMICCVGAVGAALNQMEGV